MKPSVKLDQNGLSDDERPTNLRCCPSLPSIYCPMRALILRSLFAAAGSSMLHLARGGGIGGAIFILIVAKLFHK